MQSQKLIPIIPILSRTWLIYKKFFSLFISISLMCGVFTELTTFVFQRFNFHHAGIPLIIEFLLVNFFSIAFIDASSKIYLAQRISLREVLDRPGEIYWRFTAVSLSTLLMIILGLQLWILPGLFLATLFTFANQLVILEDTKYLESFRRSVQLVRNSFGTIILFNLILVCVFLTMFLILHLLTQNYSGLESRLGKIFSIMIMPFFVIAQVGLYFEIKKRDEPQ